MDQPRLGRRVRRGQGQPPPALGLQQGDVEREAVPERDRAVLVHVFGAEDQLQVGLLQAGLRADETAAFHRVGGEGALALEQVLERRGQHPRQRAPGEAIEAGSGARVAEHGVLVVLQVLADTRQVADHLDALAIQVLRRTDPRQQQELGRIDGAGSDDHLAHGGQLLGAALARDLDAGRSPGLHQHPAGQGAGDHRQVGPMGHRLQEGARRGHPLAVLLGHVPVAEAVLLGPVEVVGAAQLQLVGGGHEGLADRMRIALAGDVQLAA